jgi:4-azaleucine resistance transporter AzlC
VKEPASVTHQRGAGAEQDGRVDATGDPQPNDEGEPLGPEVPTTALVLAGPVALGLIPLGLALGVVVVHAGLPWWWATVFASVVYAGSLEFLLVGMAVTGVPLPQVAMSSFLVNSRHAFYAVSFPLPNVKGRLGRMYSTFALTDEAYAVTTSPEAQRWSSRRIRGVQMLFHGCWVAAATIGALAASVLPLDRLAGVDFALTALFVVLAIDAYRDRPDRTAALAAIGCAVGALVLVGQVLPLGFVAFTAVQVVRARRAVAGGAS